MKQNLHSDKYLDAIYDKKLNLVEFYWKESTKDMTETEYKMVVSDIVDVILEMITHNNQKAPNWLLDNRNFLFTIPPKLQEWQAKEIFEPLMEKGCEKCAVIMSEDFISQFSIEQSFEENQETMLITEFFSDLHQANEWLQE